eukprot:GHVU01224088.1.p1 GENE.GHVU01224088.1~~GHVU01224088.1.p1  ORF type:complete len:767 (-),score=215.67 GHVU01224088.1:270-2252(-)
MKAAEAVEVKAAEAEEVKAAEPEEVKAAETEEVKAAETEEVKKAETEEVNNPETGEASPAEAEEVKASAPEELPGAVERELPQPNDLATTTEQDGSSAAHKEAPTEAQEGDITSEKKLGDSGDNLVVPIKDTSTASDDEGVEREESMTRALEDAAPPEYLSRTIGTAENTTADEEDAPTGGAVTLQLEEALGSAKEANANAEEYFDPSMESQQCDYSNAFAAADEDKTGRLSHRDLSRVLHTLPLGLDNWDLVLLLAEAEEDDEGFVRYEPFVPVLREFAPLLKDRRNTIVAKAEREEGKRVASVGAKTLGVCFDAEFAETAKRVEAEDGDKTTSERAGGDEGPSDSEMPRTRFLRRCRALPHRLTPLECRFAAQMGHDTPNDGIDLSPADGGFRGLQQTMRLEMFRYGAGLGATTNPRFIQHELMAEINNVPDVHAQVDKVAVWELREVLLRCKSLFLSRMQIHVLLSLQSADEDCYVDIEDFIHVCCRVVPLLFDPQRYINTENALAKKEEVAAQQSDPLIGSGLTDDAPGDKEKKSKDLATVEKSLLQVFTIMDDRRSGSIPLSLFSSTLRKSPKIEKRFIDLITDAELSDVETAGVIAECVLPPESDEVAYAEHIKTWMPIVFDLRSSDFYQSIIRSQRPSEETGGDEEGGPAVAK